MFNQLSKILRAFMLAGPSLLLWLAPQTAHAVPSYASQTGAPCASCHTTAFGPGLTQFGQQFKLNGYVWGAAKTDIPPVAAMVISTFTNTQAAQDGGAAPHFSPNNNLAVDQTSLFYAGRITSHLGAFIQVTYDGIAQRIAWDNFDLRYANSFNLDTHHLVWGVSVNNSPTVQDLWNTTPAWSYPYIGSALAPTPSASPILEGTLAQEVYGATAYTMIDNLLYLEGGGYHTLPNRALSKLGSGANSVSPSHGMSPYWRAALQKNYGASYAELGVFGIDIHQYPGGDASSGTDHYTDLGYDATYSYTYGSHNVQVLGTLIHELQKLDATYTLGGSTNASDQLNTVRASAQYTYRQTYVGSVGGFAIHGSDDTGLYGGGSANGSPNSRGYLTQVEYIPFGKAGAFWAPYLNVRLGLQYTYYTQFNGGGANYDGAGRSANDNNTLFGFLWLAF